MKRNHRKSRSFSCHEDKLVMKTKPPEQMALRLSNHGFVYFMRPPQMLSARDLQPAKRNFATEVW